MDGRSLAVVFLFLPLLIGSWQDKRSGRELRRDIHYHSKRHMFPRETKKRTTTPRSREMRKKPSGYLAPLQEEEIGDDEIVSVAVGPPARPKYEKLVKTHKPNNTPNTNSVNFIKDILIELAKDMLTHELNADFIFGQYVGTAIKNIKEDLKIKVQHEILNIIQRYQQTKNASDIASNPFEATTAREEIKAKLNETYDLWPDFTNLANIVS